MQIEQLNDYDHIIVAYSGGKDSTACLLNLIDLGVDLRKVEVWHHLVDGREGSHLMDWAVTEDYCRKFAKAMHIPLYYSWKVGGFEREMNRQNQRTAAICFEVPDGDLQKMGGDRGNKNTRRMFPQVSADLSVRWCSSYLKIDVAKRALNNQPRFRNAKTLFITGERAEESTARAHYKQFEPHASDRRNGKRVVRWIDHWRPVHQWDEQRIWDEIAKHRINPHPAYRIGWGRLSCASCIFGSDNQWASLDAINPEQTDQISEYEEDFDTTIHRTLSVKERIMRGQPYNAINEVDVDQALSNEYTQSIFVKNWELPAGAFGEQNGPI